MLEDFDYYDDADYEYVDMRGVIRRLPKDIIIPVTVQYDGTVLLGDPPVDRFHRVEFASSLWKRNSVCGTPLKNTCLPIALIAIFQIK